MKKSSKSIDILLPTYNGEKYLSQLINSILDQTYQDWHLIIHDDGSSDKSLEIIKKYTTLNPSKITLIDDNKIFNSVVSNFNHLLKHSKADYIMFCDQDDVWFNTKIEQTLERMLVEEKKASFNCPILIHTDLIVVDENLQHISSSLWKYQKIKPEFSNRLYFLLSRNSITGCTVMFNKALRDISQPIPELAIMHDWWISLNAVKYGRICYIDAPTIYYRQHLSNSLGAKKADNFYMYFVKKLNVFKTIKSFYNTIKMIQELNFKINWIKFLMVKVYIALLRTK